MTRQIPRVLVVDDEPDMCWALENALTPAGFAVTTAVRGTDALELLAHNSYAVVFLDAKLPDLDGLEMATAIRQRSPGTAIVLISGYFYEEDEAIADGMQTGLIVGFLAKPFDLADVRVLARQMLQRVAQEG